MRLFGLILAVQMVVAVIPHMTDTADIIVTSNMRDLMLIVCAVSVTIAYLSACDKTLTGFGLFDT